MTGDELAANFIVNARWETLPDAVKQKIRMCLVDSVGAALAGGLTRVSHVTADYVAEAWRGDQATIFLADRRPTAVGAAFANIDRPGKFLEKST